jgi:hypothetical protein
MNVARLFKCPLKDICMLKQKILMSLVNDAITTACKAATIPLCHHMCTKRLLLKMRIRMAET